MSDPFTTIDQFIKNLLIGLGLEAEVTEVALNIVGAVVLGLLVGATAIILIWAERKLVARIQDRLGPNRVGPYGILQTIADGLKLVTKEVLIPQGADRYVFIMAPLIVVTGVIGIWAVMPLAPGLIGSDINVGLLYVIAVGAIGTLGIMMAGMSSNNKYALLGAFRTVAQMLSYTVPMILALLIPVMLAGSMGMSTIVEAQGSAWFIVLAPLAAIIFFISSIAEVGRAPFDLLEAESEIVAGFHIEYSGIAFGMFFVGEFIHAFTIAALFSVIFLGGWQGPAVESFPLLGLFYFILKTWFMYFVVIWVRSTLPRIRIDQINAFNWKFMTPLALVVFMVTAILDKLAVEAGFNRAAVLLAANAIIVLGTLFLLRAYATSQRRRLEVTERPQVQRSEAASD
ncbi:MAG: NADH-quinone oxidoreductase subunit NuoH [Anaerolineae bacterium]|nr:MAG: NADH-quinone oxidoreductase subunit NuoH [Anaerolineae bacterium]